MYKAGCVTSTSSRQAKTVPGAVTTPVPTWGTTTPCAPNSRTQTGPYRCNIRRMPEATQTPKAWLIYVDTDDGESREEWNVFYTPCEVWLDETLAKEREAFLNEHRPDGWAVHLTPAPLRTSPPQGAPDFDHGEFRWGADDDDEPGYDDDAAPEDRAIVADLEARVGPGPSQTLDLDD